MEEGSLIKSIDVKFFSPCENAEHVGHPITLNGKLGFGSSGGNYTTPTHINFYQCPTFKDIVLEDIPLKPIYSISKYQLSYKTFIEFFKEKCYVHNIFFTINL